MNILRSGAFLVIARTATLSAITSVTSGPRASDQKAGSVSEISLPIGYRDWKLISVAHEEGNLNDLRAVLGNDKALTAYRNETLSFPDGAIIVRLAWGYTSSKENDSAFRRHQSYVAGDATNVQLIVKDSTKYQLAGGWGFAQFKDGKPDGKAKLNTCFACHAPAKAHDYVFTHYAP